MKLIYTSTEHWTGAPSNPLLLEFRAHIDGMIGGHERIAGEASWWMWLMERDPYLENRDYWGDRWERTRVDLQQIIHARRVLSRLERFGGSRWKISLP